MRKKWGPEFECLWNNIVVILHSRWSLHLAIVPMEGAVLFELSIDGTLSKYLNICVTIFGNNQKRNTHLLHL